MGKVIYFMMVSLDGFAEGPDRNLDWATIDEEIHTFANDQTRETGVLLYGRRLYEVMTYWQTADEDPSLPGYMADFARIWREKPKIVASRTLKQVGPNATLIRDNITGEVAKLKEQLGGVVSVGGPSLAATLIRHGLVDEYRLLVHPVVLGGGTPFLPALDRPIRLRLLETREFRSGGVYLRYENASGNR